MMKRSTALFISTTALALMGTAAVGTGPALAREPASGTTKDIRLSATLSQLNRSGASGSATAVVKNQKIESIQVTARGLTPDAPHAQHIHFGADARHECPTLFRDDANKDGFLNTVEGTPAYGPIVVSLTTTGDTTPASSLAVARFPVSADGSFSYFRNNIEFTDWPASAPPSRSRTESARARASWSSTASTTTATGCTTSRAAAPASSTRACPPRPPTRPPAASSTDTTAHPGTADGPPHAWGGPSACAGTPRHSGLRHRPIALGRLPGGCL